MTLHRIYVYGLFETDHTARLISPRHSINLLNPHSKSFNMDLCRLQNTIVLLNWLSICKGYSMLLPITNPESWPKLFLIFPIFVFKVLSSCCAFQYVCPSSHSNTFTSSTSFKEDWVKILPSSLTCLSSLQNNFVLNYMKNICIYGA